MPSEPQNDAAPDGATEATRRSSLLDPWTRSVSWVLRIPIRAYRLLISRWTPASCRFSPTCSAYAERALTTHGVFRAAGLIVWRVLRCQPFARGGYDPVPHGSRSHRCPPSKESAAPGNPRS